MKLSHTVTAEDAGRPVKSILKTRMNLSERLIKKLKYENKIFCNSFSVYVNHIVSINDFVVADIDFVEESDDIFSEPMYLDILYEDESLIALNKPSGIVVHPVCSHPTGTIANGLKHYFIQKGLTIKIRPVSRLDRDTTGIIIFAKNQFVQEALIRQMADDTFNKEYVGVVKGHVISSSGTINLPIDRKPDSIMLRHISDSGYSAVTHYEVIEYLDDASFLKFRLETGRTHQIRVHCQAIGHPLLGDTLYSTPENEYTSALIGRQALHSIKAGFIHPVQKYYLELRAPIPSDIIKLLEILRK